MRDLEETTLTVEEMEALRLKDAEGLDQNTCAERMNLSQSSFQRLLSGARTKVTGALVDGRAIRIDGGSYQLVASRWTCGACGVDWEGRRVPQSSEACPSCGSPETRPRRRGGEGFGPPPWGRGRGCS